LPLDPEWPLAVAPGEAGAVSCAVLAIACPLGRFDAGD
jgi:hypothetical protein